MNKIILAIIFSIIIGSGIGFFIALNRDMPEIRELETFRPPSITRIYSQDNVLLDKWFIENREIVSIKEIPEYIIKAIITTEDRQFYNHYGISFKGILRAIVKDIIAGKFVEGASTITQQLAKTLFLTSKKTIIRKIKEAFLALQIERRYTKKEILELYLNQVYFGSGAYGVKSAAKKFFNKNLDELTLSQCALIAGMPKAPSYYSPLVNPKISIKRRNLVLKQMFKTGIINKEDYQKSINEKLELGGKENNNTNVSYYVSYIRSVLEEEYGDAIIYKKGITVISTLNYKFQRIAQDAVNNGLAKIHKRNASSKKKFDMPQAALISIKNSTGEILAMVGGMESDNDSFNRATMARRQPGSAFKPILFAYAIQKGYKQNSLLLDSPVLYKGYFGHDWSPENYSKKFKGEMTLKEALCVSQNIPAVRLIEQLGPESVVNFAKEIGINSPLKPNLSLALGTSELSLIELTSAYSTFPNKGVYNEPYGIRDVLDYKDRSIWYKRYEKKIVLSSAKAAIVTDMLESVVKFGTGRRAKSIDHPLAGKTGTTNKFKDALFIGFSPDITTGVWVGNDNNTSIGYKETGSKAALPIWIEFMKKVTKQFNSKKFERPDDIVIVYIDKKTGLMTDKNNNDALEMMFEKGTEPEGLNLGSP